MKPLYNILGTVYQFVDSIDVELRTIHGLQQNCHLLRSKLLATLNCEPKQIIPAHVPAAPVTIDTTDSPAVSIMKTNRLVQYVT